MPQVLQVRQRKAGDVRVRLDDGRTLEVPEQTWSRLGVPVLAPLDPELLARLERESTLTRLRRRALRLLAVRPRSSHELRTRLTSVAGAELASVVVAELEGQGLVDDRRFAAEWVRVRRELRGLGSLRLRYELARKGIPRDVADRVVGEAAGDDPSLAAEVARKYLDRYLRLPREVAARRLAGLLARRGFTADAIAHALRAVRLWSGGVQPDSEGLR